MSRVDRWYRTTVSLYTVGQGADASGGATLVRTLVKAAIPARVQYNGSSRGVIEGRDNTESTHTVYMSTVDGGLVSPGDILVHADASLEVKYVTALIPIRRTALGHCQIDCDEVQHGR
jgi:hypothetical protein